MLGGVFCILRTFTAADAYNLVSVGKVGQTLHKGGYFSVFFISVPQSARSPSSHAVHFSLGIYHSRVVDSSSDGDNWVLRKALDDPGIDNP